jgi:carbon storage regulator
MLTLTRKPGEWIEVGPDVKIVVKEIRGGAVRIGIEAPDDVKIYRGELAEKMASSAKPPNGQEAPAGA